MALLSAEITLENQPKNYFCALFNDSSAPALKPGEEPNDNFFETMMKSIVKAASISLIFLSIVAVGNAQKFGYINSAAILNEMPEMKQLKSSLESYQKILQKDGEAKVAAFRQKEQTAAQKKERGEMTPKEEETIVKELQKMQEEIYAYGQKMETDIAEKQQKDMQPILDKVNEAIQSVAKEQGFHYIFDANSGVILYADESTDVTNLVKAKLGI